MIRLLIADCQLLTREGIISLFTPINDIQVVGDSVDPDELKHLIIKLKPQVVLIDQSYVPYLHIAGTTIIDTKFKPSNFLVLFNKQNSDEIIKLIHHGIQCYICKESSREEIIEAVYATAKGEPFFCKYSAELLSGKAMSPEKDTTTPLLSPRETEIIHLIAEGMTNQEIAEKLFLSFHTIKTHRKNIIKKLGFTFKNTAELASFINAQK